MNPNQQLTARQKQYRQAKRRRQMQLRFFAMSFVVILLLAGVITAIIELPGKLSAQNPQSTSQPTSTAQDGTVSDGQDTPDALPPAGSVQGSLGPQMQTEISYTQPSAALSTLPANGRVDMEYFSDALFIGDSITQGFQVYGSGLSNAHFAAYLGAGPKQMISGTVTNISGQVVTAMDEIVAAAPKKVYILLGTNSLPALKDEAFLKYYKDFLDALEPKLPADTVYYLQGIPPVTAEKSESNEDYDNTRIKALNESIAALAYARGWHYLDLNSALADETGALRTDLLAGSDGIHLNGAGYETWKEYLVTHTAYSKTSPYIAGSPYVIG